MQTLYLDKLQWIIVVKIIKTKKDFCVLSVINAAHIGRLSDYAEKLSNS